MTQEKLPELSIFFPFWNEEKNIERVVALARDIAPTIAEKWEILLIDDGSTDKTLAKAQELARHSKHIRVISHSPNRGYGASLKEGLLNSQYKYIVFTDGDNQFDFSEVTKFINEIGNADIVIGYRKHRNDTVFRHLLMNMLKVWDFVLFGFHFKDIDCGFKMFKRHALEEIMPLRSEGAMITTEILAKAVKKKLIIAQVGVEHYPRKYGVQTGANLFVITRAVIESISLWLDIKNGRF